MKVLITGGLGFIGSHLAERCLRANNVMVHVVDDLSTGKRENVDTGRYEEFYYENKPRFWVLEADITKAETWERLDKDYDVIFHVAARASIPQSVADPLGSHEQNVGGLLRVLEFARKTGAKVVFSSSSSVYGDTKKIPNSEEDYLSPVSPYAAQKLVGEVLLAVYARVYGLDSVALRYFNVYGERQPSNNSYSVALSIFLNQKKRGEPLSIVGNGQQRRDFVYVKDVAEANMLAAVKMPKGFTVFNIGCGESYAINQITDWIDPKGPRVYLPARLEPAENLADNLRAKEVLGWQPQVRLFDWLKKQCSVQ